ncbi:hypothetical protein [Blastopirellula retiformator]|uniref:Uncharacterized protein n=1 Tax=Blastopirellula retiformator TaxID=2527970 RepID=A0A5C5UVK8_9BACT|nr:hypothetical protein [Blastopirellula retiformator]TWT29869.1 hypothetical protein Enr8_45250 [Blastopirellula retiformator]
MFREGSELTAKQMTDRKKPNAPPVTVKVAPTDASLQPSAEPIAARVISCEKADGGTIKLVLETDGDTSGFQVTKVARVWLVE